MSLPIPKIGTSAISTCTSAMLRLRRLAHHPLSAPLLTREAASLIATIRVSSSLYTALLAASLDSPSTCCAYLRISQSVTWLQVE